MLGEIKNIAEKIAFYEIFIMFISLFIYPN
jgi:hypothetical protein